MSRMQYIHLCSTQWRVPLQPPTTPAQYPAMLWWCSSRLRCDTVTEQQAACPCDNVVLALSLCYEHDWLYKTKCALNVSLHLAWRFTDYLPHQCACDAIPGTQ